MLLYHYTKTDGSFRSTSEAKLDPLESKIQGKDVYLIPANATIQVPPPVMPDETPVFENNKWVVKTDLRGQTAYLKATGEPVTIRTLDVLDTSLSMVEPTVPYPLWDELTKSWVNNTAAVVSAEYEAKIEARIRATAISDLKAIGELPIDFKDNL